MNTKQLAPVLDIKSIEETGVFTGYASVFSVTDSQNEKTVPGCFAPSLADHKRRGSRPKMFWQHDMGQPIGKWVDMAEDGRGLYVEGKLNMGVQRAREAYELLKEGDIDGLSIGYVPQEWEPDPKKDGVTLLKRVNLLEVSIVSIGSCRPALIDNVKSVSDHYALLRNRIVAGELPSDRELEKGVRDALDLSNAQAERFVRLLRKGQALGEPGNAPNDANALAALAVLRDAIKGFPLRT